MLFEELSATVINILSCVEDVGLYEAVWQLHWQKLTNDPEFNENERLQIFQIAGAILHMLRYVRLEEAALYQVFTENAGVSKLLYLKAFEQIRPFLTYVDNGLSVCNRACARALLKIFGKASCFCVGEGLVDVVLKDTEISWRGVDRNYALLRYLIDTNDMNQIIRLVTDNSWLDFVRQTDFCLLRMGWRALKEKGLLNVKKIYTDSNHINNCFNKTTSLNIYDLLMRMEIAVAHTDSIECFLDIPSVYSTDIDKEQKGDWNPEDYLVWKDLRRNATTMEETQLRHLMNQYVITHGIKHSVIAFLWEIICRLLSQREKLTVEDVQQYIRHACESGSLRLIADGVLYFGVLDDVFKLIW